MSIVPIRGRRENIRAELLELANDPTITGLVIGIVRGPDADNEKIMTINIGKRATRANIALCAASFAYDAIYDAELPS